MYEQSMNWNKYQQKCFSSMKQSDWVHLFSLKCGIKEKHYE